MSLVWAPTVTMVLWKPNHGERLPVLLSLLLPLPLAQDLLQAPV